MKSDAFTIASLLIGAISLLISIVTGLLGAYIASVSALAILVLSWWIWVTVKLVKLEARITPTLEKALHPQTGGAGHMGSIAAVIPYRPIYSFLQDRPEIIDAPKNKVQIPADFLEKDSFTLLFWAEITEEFLDSSTNRYLFAYTTDPNRQSGKTLEYPNAFFLGILGGTLKWRFVIKGPNPANGTTVMMSTSKALHGWKLFAVTWSSSRNKLSFTVDAGQVFKDERTLPKESFPVNMDGHFFHLGGWLNTWHGGMALLKFYNFRVFERNLTHNEIRDVYDREFKTIGSINR